MPCSQHLANPLLNRLFRNQGWTGKPSSLYFGLLNSPPTNTVAGTGHTEVTISSATGYARVGVVVTHTDNTTFQVGTGEGGNGIATNRITNSQDILWSRSVATWGNVTHIGIFSAATSGSLLMWFELPSGGTVISANTRFRIEAQKLDLGFDSSVVGNALALTWLNWAFRNTAPTIPANLYLALATATGPASITEIASTNGYARGGGPNGSATAGINTSSTFSSPSNGFCVNSAGLFFPTSSGAWNGGAAITHFALMSGTTLGAGDVYFHGQLNESIVVGTSGVAPNWLGSALSFYLVE